MAWRCHGTDNNSLVKKLQQHGIVQSEEVATTMLAVDRGHYVEQRAYEDAPQRIGYNITISAPHMHAHALELLRETLKPGCRALDIGSGSGYLTVCNANFAWLSWLEPVGRLLGSTTSLSWLNLARRT